MVICVLYYHPDDLVFKEFRVYWGASSVQFEDLELGIELFHVIAVCCVPPLEEYLEALVGLHHGPCTLYILSHETYDAPNDFQDLDTVFHIVDLVIPLGPL